MSLDYGSRRPMNTIMELSPEQAQTSPEELDFSRDSTGLSLSPLAQGLRSGRERSSSVLILFQEHWPVSSRPSWPCRRRTKLAPSHSAKEKNPSYRQRKKSTRHRRKLGKSSSRIVIVNNVSFERPLKKYENGPVRSMADVDAELALLQMWASPVIFYLPWFRFLVASTVSNA